MDIVRDPAEPVAAVAGGFQITVDGTSCAITLSVNNDFTGPGTDAALSSPATRTRFSTNPVVRQRTMLNSRSIDRQRGVAARGLRPKR